jgi:hypothetical protein
MLIEVLHTKRLMCDHRLNVNKQRQIKIQVVCTDNAAMHLGNKESAFQQPRMYTNESSNVLFRTVK